MSLKNPWNLGLGTVDVSNSFRIGGGGGGIMFYHSRPYDVCAFQWKPVRIVGTLCWFPVTGMHAHSKRLLPTVGGVLSESSVIVRRQVLDVVKLQAISPFCRPPELMYADVGCF